jgi:ADP-ribose pyrophosphatase YjhB (NUDIX family)
MYIDRIPKKRMAVGALLRDPSHRLLIVKPTYRSEWLVPGGAVELDESPRRACMRELREELGIGLRLNRLLCVDYRPADESRSEAVHFIFDGGILDGDLVKQFRLPQNELETYSFLAPAEAFPLLDVHLSRRMAHAFVALAEGVTIYLEDGCIPS